MIFCCPTKKQVDILDLRSALLSDFKQQISDTPLRNYSREGDRMSAIENFTDLKNNFEPDIGRCNFSVHKMNDENKNEIINRFSYLGGILETAQIRFQMVSGKGVLLPHRDENRKSSIVILLKGDSGVSEFYEDRPENLGIFPNYKTMKLSYSCKMEMGINYIYNHAAFHSVRISEPPRIAVTICWDSISADELVKIVNA